MSISLRRTTERDLAFVMAAENKPENQAFIIGWTHQQHTASLSDVDILPLIIEDENGSSVGFVILAGLANTHQSLEFRRIVVTEKGRGIGRAAVRAVQSLVFGALQAHRLWLDVIDHNGRARHLYLTEGFKEEGTLCECLRLNDRWESLVVLSLLKHEYETRPAVKENQQ